MIVGPASVIPNSTTSTVRLGALASRVMQVPCRVVIRLIDPDYFKCDDRAGAQL